MTGPATLTDHRVRSVRYPRLRRGDPARPAVVTCACDWTAQ